MRDRERRGEVIRFVCRIRSMFCSYTWSPVEVVVYAKLLNSSLALADSLLSSVALSWDEVD